MNILETRIKDRFPNEDITVLNYTIMKEPATVRCNICGSEYTLKKAENFVRADKKCICRKCVNNHSGGRLDLSDFQEKINKKYINEKLKLLSYTLSHESCDVQCLKCGNIYHFATAGQLLDPDKHRVCSYCFPNKREQMQNTIQKFQVFIQNNVDFELIDVLDNQIHSNTLIHCKCKKCGLINAKTIYDYLRGRGCSCEGNNVMLTQEQYQAELGEEYTLLSEYKGREHSVKIRHNLCGFCYDTNARHYTCPKCSGSKGEKTIAFLLEQQGISYYREKQEDINGHKLRFDFYIPTIDTYIEFQGEQHYKAKAYFGGEAGLQKQQAYDEYKIQWCQENNHKLLTINYNDNIQNKLQEYLLKFNDYPVKEYIQADGSGNNPKE